MPFSFPTLRRLFFFFAFFSLITPGCNPRVKKEKLDENVKEYSSSFPFQPKRTWRLEVSWEPFALDEKKALISKEFQLLIQDDKEREKLEKQIRDHGGDEPYLLWLESQLIPLGDLEVRAIGRIIRYQDRTVVLLAYRAPVEIERRGLLTAGPVSFPDPLLRALRDGCPVLEWEQIQGDDSFGIEVVLVSRARDPRGLLWKPEHIQVKGFSSRSWSVVQGRQLAYRSLVALKDTVSRCPLPLTFRRLALSVGDFAPMGVEW
ncbi:MAG: hypothetical protein AB1540_14875 [Bdellovibrionota bacterium]